MQTIPSTARNMGRFPTRLRQVLNNKNSDNAIWWHPHGKSFAILPEEFQDILKTSFEGTKLDSFTRKLNRWGFRRTTSHQSDPVGSLAFGHLLFLRNQPELEVQMKGVRQPSSKHKPQHDSNRVVAIQKGDCAPFLPSSLSSSGPCTMRTSPMPTQTLKYCPGTSSGNFYFPDVEAILAPLEPSLSTKSKQTAVGSKQESAL